MLKTYETAGIAAALNAPDTAACIDSWCQEYETTEGIIPDKELIMQGVQLLRSIQVQTDAPLTVWKKADWYAQTTGIQGGARVRELLSSFAASGLLDYESKAEPIIDSEVFQSPEAQELLFKMIQENNLNTVKLLIEGGIDLHILDDQALHLAITHALNNSLYNEIPDSWHYKAAISDSHTPPECRMMKLLLLNGADPNARAGLFLHKAVACQNIPITKILIDAGADVSAYSESLIKIAYSRMDMKMINFLFKNGASLANLEPSVIEMLQESLPDNTVPPVKPSGFQKSAKFSPYEYVMDSRKVLVEKIKENLQTTRRLIPPAWDREAFKPHNPVSNVVYRGVNRMRLIYAAISNNYQDSRWCTQKQALKAGWTIKKGAQPVICEKWIFAEVVPVLDKNNKPVLDSNKKPVTKTVQLPGPS